MHEKALNLAATAAMILGIIAAIVNGSRKALPEPAPGALVPIDAPAPPRFPSPGESFDIDITGCREKLLVLPETDRGDQLADWAVYGTLFHTGLSDEDLRSATFDRAPLRLRALEEVFNFEYGPGRQVTVGDETWVFHPADQSAPAAVATLARMVDQARMTRGEVPKTVRAFAYKSQVARGVIGVTCEAVEEGAAWFTPQRGYVSAVVFSLDQLQHWLDQVDDVVAVERASAGVMLGGRRFAGWRTAGVSTDDIAALYQAQARIRHDRPIAQARLDAATGPLEKAWQRMIDAHNGGALLDRRSGSLADALMRGQSDTADFAAAVQQVEALLSDSSLAERLRQRLGQPPQAPVTFSDALRKPTDPLLGGSIARGPGLLTDPAIAPRTFFTEPSRRAEIERLRPLVRARLATLHAAARKSLAAEGVLLVSEPGFSLDPQVNVAGLSDDLQRAIDTPAALIADANRLAEAGAIPDESRRPSTLWYAIDLSAAFRDEDASAFALQPEVRTQFESFRSALQSAIDPTDAADIATAEQARLRNDLLATAENEQLAGADRLAALRARLLLDYIVARNRFQCARYDGPLAGTHVGMVLYYTDLLAKLWQSLDFGRQAPSFALPGFVTIPVASAELEPQYWEESNRLTSTRLWFGTKPEGYSLAADGAMLFAPISTRVYAAGSDPLDPKKEESPSEHNRRAFAWWDRHYANVADFEPQYHVLNQIMKWSVITGWLVENNLLSELAGVSVTRSHRFDAWYAANSDLRFREPLPMLDRSRWPDPATEAIDIISSYRFHRGSSARWVEGGVSLGSAQSLGPSARIGGAVNPKLRRGGADYARSAEGRIVMSEFAAAKGAVFELPPRTSGGAAARVIPSPQARLRVGGSEMPAAPITLEFAASSVRLGEGAASIGSLLRLDSGRNVALRWVDGAFEMHRALAADFAAASSQAVPMSASLMPNRGAAIVVRGDTLKLVIEQPGGAKWILEDAVAGARPEAGEMIVGVRQSGLTLRARPLEATATDPRLEAAWQKLMPADGPDNIPGHVYRFFCDETPPLLARRVEIEVGVQPPLEARVTGNAVYVRRPAAGTDVYLNLVERARIDGKTIRQLVESAEGKWSVLDSDAAAAPAGAAAIGGQPGAALKQLKLAADAGQLEPAVARLKLDLQLAVSRGRAPESAGGYFDAMAGNASPAEMLTRALVKLRGGQTRAATEMLNATAPARGPPWTSQNVAAQLRAAGQPVAADFVQLQGGLSGATAPVQSATTAAVDSAGQLITITRARVAGAAAMRDVTIAPASPRARAKLQTGQKPSHVFVEDALLTHLDWDLAPARTLARVAGDPAVNIAVVPANAFGRFRPTDVFIGETRYRMVGIGNTHPSRPAEVPYGGAAGWTGWDDDEDDDEREPVIVFVSQSPAAAGGLQFVPVQAAPGE